MNFAEILNWIKDNYELIVAFAFIIDWVLRLFPTTKNISITDFVKKIYDFLIPNLQVKESTKIKEIWNNNQTRVLKRQRKKINQVLNRHTQKIYHETEEP